MKLNLPPTPEKPEDEPFKHDLFRDPTGEKYRERFGEKLADLIKNVDDGIVVSLDAPWGEGKTQFVRMWRQLLKNQNIKSIYFDAFANDFANEPFVAITSEISCFADREFEENSTIKAKLEAYTKNAAKVAAQSLAWATKLGLKAATLNTIKNEDLESLSEIKNDIAGGLSGLAENFFKRRIANYESELKNIEGFKNSLAALASTIKEETDGPLVVIIDELDRCRPTYAVDLIEKIKHFFSVENTVFVLSMNKEQLIESIRCVYGQEIEANIYLQKFITLECPLPRRPTGVVSDYETYSSWLYGQHDLSSVLENPEDQKDLRKTATALSSHFRLTLRDIEKLFNHVTVFLASGGAKTFFTADLILLLAIIKVRDPELYEKLKDKKADIKSARSFLHIYPRAEETTEYIDRLEAIFKLIFEALEPSPAYSDGDPSVERLSGELRRRALTRDQLIPLLCSHLDLGGVFR